MALLLGFSCCSCTDKTVHLLFFFFFFLSPNRWKTWLRHQTENDFCENSESNYTFESKLQGLFTKKRGKAGTSGTGSRSLHGEWGWVWVGSKGSVSWVWESGPRQGVASLLRPLCITIEFSFEHLQRRKQGGLHIPWYQHPWLSPFCLGIPTVSSQAVIGHIQHYLWRFKQYQKRSFPSDVGCDEETGLGRLIPSTLLTIYPPCPK